jgi:hypothetical protein
VVPYETKNIQYDNPNAIYNVCLNPGRGSASAIKNAVICRCREFPVISKTRGTVSPLVVQITPGIDFLL